MPSDSLTLSNYMAIARWLTGKLEPRIGGQKPVYGPTLPKYTPKEETMLLDHLRNKREAL